jgi:hypothetical protein
MAEQSTNSVFDRLRRSKYGYVASGWAALIANLEKPDNRRIAEIIKNDRDFFAHNEAVQSAKDIGKLRRAIKAAIGRAGAIAYMEESKRRENGMDTAECRPNQQSWSWHDFTSRLIDVGLETPKGERGMWILNCGKLKKGEKVKLPGTRDEYEVLAIQGGEAKITGPLGRISAESEILVWRPGSQYAEKVIGPEAETKPAVKPNRNMQVVGETGVRTISHEELEAIKAKKETATRKGEPEMVKPSQSQSKAAAAAKLVKKSRPQPSVEPVPEQESANRWQKNDGEVQFRFGMPVRRGKMSGKVIRAHGSKLRVRLDNDEGTAEWNADDEAIFWKDPIAVKDEEEETPQEAPKPEKKKTKPVPVPEPFDADFEDEDEDEDDEIDPDDLPDDDDDLLVASNEEEEEQEDEDEEEDEDDDPDDEDDEDDSANTDAEDDPDDGGEGDVEGDMDREFIYNGKDLEGLTEVDYQRIQRLKANGVLDGTFLVADNGRVMYSFEAVDRIKNAPRNKPGRPPGGGKKQQKAALPVASRSSSVVPKAAEKPQPRPRPEPAQQEINIEISPVKPSERQMDYDKGTKEKPDQSAVAYVTKSSKGIRTAADIFGDTINELAVQIAQRQKEIGELQQAMEALEGLARRNR